MKKNYSIVIFIVALVFHFTVLCAQPGWTVYNNTNSSLPNTTVFRSVAIDQSGNVWAGGSYTGLYKFNGSTWAGYDTYNSNIAHDDVDDIVVDNSNKIWAANYKGISVLNGSTFTNYDTLNAGFKGASAYAMAKDNSGTIWVATKNGSFGYKGIATFNGSVWSNLSGFPSQIASAEFPDFAFTASNNAWIASNPGITLYNGTFNFYPKATTGLWSAQSVAVDASGVVWAGGFDGLLKNNAGAYTMYDNVAFFGFSSNTFFYDILPDGNILWIGTSAGLLKFDRTTSTVLANYKSGNSPLQDNCVVKIAKAANGDIWLATTVGVVKMVPSQVGAVAETDIYPVSVYPNPTADIVRIEQQQSRLTSYKIYTLEGAEVTSGKLTGNETVLCNLSLPGACYLLYLLDEEGMLVSVRRLVMSR